MYYDLYTEKKPVPTLFFFAVLAIIFFLVMFIYQQRVVKTKLQSNVEITRFEIGNVTSESISVYWQTDKTIDGYIKYGLDKNNLDKTAYHDQDTNRQLHHRSNHLISIKNLSPASDYYFALIINDQPVKNIDNQPF